MLFRNNIEQPFSCISEIQMLFPNNNEQHFCRISEIQMLFRNNIKQHFCHIFEIQRLFRNNIRHYLYSYLWDTNVVPKQHETTFDPHICHSIKHNMKNICIAVSEIGMLFRNNIKQHGY